MNKIIFIIFILLLSSCSKKFLIAYYDDINYFVYMDSNGENDTLSNDDLSLKDLDFFDDNEITTIHFLSFDSISKLKKHSHKKGKFNVYYDDIDYYEFMDAKGNLYQVNDDDLNFKDFDFFDDNEIMAIHFLSTEEIEKIWNQDEIKNSNFWTGNGSGILISEDGYILTNFHVIENTYEIGVEFTYNEEVKKYNAKVIKTDRLNDLAIIKIDDTAFVNLNPPPYNFKTEISNIGEQVFSLGYPMAFAGMGRDIKFTEGRISSQSGFNGNIKEYQTTSAIYAGNSGGPLFDFKGNLIGINSSTFFDEEDFGSAESASYAIKLKTLDKLLKFINNDKTISPITLPSTTELSEKELTEQIKEISQYVVLIKVK